MSDYEPDQNPEAEGIPEMYDAPPGRDIETNEEALMVPRDYPIAAGQDPTYAVTAAEDRMQETVADRAAREKPEVGEADLDEEAATAGHLISPDSGVDSADETAEEVGLLAEDDSAALTAEEAAIHVASEDVAEDIDPAAEAAAYLEDR